MLVDISSDVKEAPKKSAAGAPSSSIIDITSDLASPKTSAPSGLVDITSDLKGSNAHAVPTLGQERPLSFDEAKALLTWSPSGDRNPFIRAPIASDVNAPVTMQPTPGDVAGASAVSLLNPTLEAAPKAPQTREDLGLFKMLGIEGEGAKTGRAIGEAVGFPKTGEYVGKTVEDLANPMTIPEMALLGAGTEMIARPILSKVGLMEAPEVVRAAEDAALSARDLLAARQEDATRLPLYPERPSSKELIFKKQKEEMSKIQFPDEPPEFKVLDQIPTRAVLDPLTGKTTQEPAPPLPENEVKAALDKALTPEQKFSQLKSQALDQALGTPPREMTTMPTDAVRAVKLTNGNVIKVGEDFNGDHADLLNTLGVKPAEVESYGWLRNGEYLPKPANVVAPRLTVESAKNLVDAARALQQRDPNFIVPGEDVQRLFKRIGTAIRLGVMSMDDLSPTFREAGYTPQMVADLYETAVSQSGKTLQQLSQFARELNNTIKGRIVGMQEVPPSVLDKAWNGGRTVFNVWRTALTSALATASRNATTGTAIGVGMEGINEAMVVAEKSIFKRTPIKEAVEPFMESLYAIGRRLTPAGRKDLEAILDQQPVLRVKLYGTPINDALYSDKISYVLGTFNRIQEFFVREMVTAAGVARRMAEAGLDPKKVPVPFKILDTSIQEALEATMASTPKNAVSRGMIRAFNEFYPLQLAYPFPRYLSNALGTLYKWSPAKPLVMGLSGDLAKLPFEEQMRVINRAVIGSTLMAGAAYLRNTKYAGDKWNEIRPTPDTDPNYVMDARPFGPLLPGHLFITELASRIMRKNETGEPIGFGMKDYMEGALGINRMAGTTLFSVSQLSAQNIENINEFALRMAGEFLGGFTTPFRTFRDLISAFVPEELVYRDVRQAPLTGPALSNIPFAQRLLPEKNFSTGTNNSREDMAVRQLLGISLQTKDPLRSEMDRLRIQSLAAEPRTGDPEVDNMVREKMGPLAEKEIYPELRSREYQKLSFRDQTLRLTQLLSAIKRQAVASVLEANPEYQKVIEEKMKEQLESDYLPRPKKTMSFR